MREASVRWLILALVGLVLGCASPTAAGKSGKVKYVSDPTRQPFSVFIGRRPVKIDGDLSDWPKWLPVARVGNAEGTHAALIRVFVDASRVYAAFEVTDPTPSVNKQVQGLTYNGDALELFLGTHDEPRSSLKPGDVQVLISYNPAAPHAWNNYSNQPMKNAQVVQKDVPGGWVVEASFTHAELGLATPVPGQPVWIDFALDDASGGARTAQFPWLGTLALWKTPSMWKKSIFVPAP